MYKNLSIFIFTWNHQALRISAPSVECILPYTLHDPDFYPAIESILTSHKPDVVVFGSQEDPSPGSYFHSHFLPEALAKIQYNLLKRTKMMGVGVETYKSIKALDFKLRGLRLSIYSKQSLYGGIQLEERYLSTDNAWVNCSYPFVQSKGAVVSYLKIPGYGCIAFVCAHLPFDADNLKRAHHAQSYEIRNQSLELSNRCFNRIVKDLVHTNFIGESVDSVFFFGDLNYRVFSTEKEDLFHSTSCSMTMLQKIYMKHDELYHAIQEKHIDLPFREGIHNEGPRFLPTCKMRKPRISKSDRSSIRDMYNIGSGQRQPSWCDRILYYSFNKSQKIRCLMYDRIDEGKTMEQSDHAAVYGLFYLTKE
jgi:hypothetical protein